jgi:hypothetical protein
LLSVSFPIAPTLPGVPTRLYEFSRNAAMMPVWLVYAMVPTYTVSSCDNVTPVAAVSPQCPLVSRISGMLRVSIDLGGGEVGVVWRSCRSVVRVKGLNCPGGEAATWVYGCSAGLDSVYLQVSAREMVAPSEGRPR